MRENWLRLNAYGALIGVLEVVTAVAWLADPDPAARVLGWSGHIGYGIGGVALLAAYVRRRVDVEVYASLLLIASNILDLAFEIRTADHFPTRSAVISAAVIVFVSMRISALLQGGSYVIPVWDRDLWHRRQARP